MDDNPTLATVKSTSGLAVAVLVIETFLYLALAPNTHQDALAAAFFAIQTMTTAGTGSLPLTRPLIVLASIFHLVGTAIWALFVGQFAGYVLSRIHESE